MDLSSGGIWRFGARPRGGLKFWWGRAPSVALLGGRGRNWVFWSRWIGLDWTVEMASVGLPRIAIRVRVRLCECECDCASAFCRMPAFLAAFGGVGHSWAGISSIGLSLLVHFSHVQPG